MDTQEEEEKKMLIKRGQIWIRRPDPEFVETWTVRVEVVSENSVAFSIIDFEGEKPEGTLMSMKKEKFIKLYKLKKVKDAKSSEESE